MFYKYGKLTTHNFPMRIQSLAVELHTQVNNPVKYVMGWLWKSTSNSGICFLGKMVNFGVSTFVNFVRSRRGLMRITLQLITLWKQLNPRTRLKGSILVCFLLQSWEFNNKWLGNIDDSIRKVYFCLHYQRMMLAIGSVLFKSPVEFMELINHEGTAIHLLPVVQQNIVSPCPKVSLNKILEVHGRFPQHIKHALACQGEGFLVTFYTARI